MLLGVMWINKLSFYLSTCFDIGSLCTLLAVYRSVSKNGVLIGSLTIYLSFNVIVQHRAHHLMLFTEMLSISSSAWKLK